MRIMFYIKTPRGWRPLHRRNHELAKLWRDTGLDVEEKVTKLTVHDVWVSERNYAYMEVVRRLLNSARQRAREKSLKFDLGYGDFEIPLVCPLRGVPLKVGFDQHNDDSPSLDRKDPRLGYVKENVWVISHKANRLKGDFTPNELKTFCENAMELDWITWTSDENNELRKRQAERKLELNETHRPRWWTLWGREKSDVK